MASSFFSSYSKSNKLLSSSVKNNNNRNEEQIPVALLGNSILYYNNCPRLTEQMLRTKFGTKFKQHSCLHGNEKLSTLLEKGNGMHNKFGRHPNSISCDKDCNTIRDIGALTIQDLLSTQENNDDSTSCSGYVITNNFRQHPTQLDTLKETTKVLEDH